MGQPDLFRMPHKPWNSGRLIGAKAPLKSNHIWAIRQHWPAVALLLHQNRHTYRYARVS